MRFKHLDKTIRALDRLRKGKWAKLIKGTPKKEPARELCTTANDQCPACIVGFLTKGCSDTPWGDWREAVTQDCNTCPVQVRCNEGDKVACPENIDSPEAKKHAKRESRMLGAIQKGLEVMQRELAKIK